MRFDKREGSLARGLIGERFDELGMLLSKDLNSEIFK